MRLCPEKSPVPPASCRNNAVFRQRSTPKWLSTQRQRGRHAHKCDCAGTAKSATHPTPIVGQSRRPSAESRCPLHPPRRLGQSVAPPRRFSRLLSSEESVVLQ